MKRQIESSFIKTEWKCHACPWRYQPQNQFLELSKKHLRRGGCLCFLLWRWTIEGFLFYPPVLEDSLILVTYFPFDFGEVFFFLDCSDPKLELLVTWSEPGQTGFLVAHIYWGNRNMYLEESPFSHCGTFLYDLPDQQFLCVSWFYKSPHFWVWTS